MRAAVNKKQLFTVWLKNRTRESWKNIRRVKRKKLVSLAKECKWSGT